MTLLLRSLRSMRVAGIKMQPAQMTAMRTPIYLARNGPGPQKNVRGSDIPGVNSGWKNTHPNGKQHGAVSTTWDKLGDHEQTWMGDDWANIPYKGMGKFWLGMFWFCFLGFFLGQMYDSISMDTQIHCKVFGRWGPF